MQTLWHRYEKHIYLGVAFVSVVLPWLISFSIYLAMR
jgi:hypothetical protein